MGEMKVYRGKKNYKDLARLIAYNGDTGRFMFSLFIAIFIFDIDSLTSFVLYQNQMHGMKMSAINMLEQTRQ